MTRKHALAVLAAAVGGIAGMSQITSAKESADTTSPATAAARGAKAWAENCASCHNARSPLEKNDRQWATAVTHMRVRANIPGDVANDIIVFLQASNDRQSAARGVDLIASTAAAPSRTLAPGDPEHGAQVYGGTCIACHGANGKGAIPGIPNLDERLKKSDEILLKHIVEGFQSPGSPMPMPPRGGNADLSDKDLADALAYIRKNFSQ